MLHKIIVFLVCIKYVTQLSVGEKSWEQNDQESLDIFYDFKNHFNQVSSGLEDHKIAKLFDPNQKKSDGNKLTGQLGLEIWINTCEENDVDQSNSDYIENIVDALEILNTLKNSLDQFPNQEVHTTDYTNNEADFSREFIFENIQSNKGYLSACK